MALRIQIAKFKFCQYLLRANSPNLMLTKLSCYTVKLYRRMDRKFQKIVVITCLYPLHSHSLISLRGVWYSVLCTIWSIEQTPSSWTAMHKCNWYRIINCSCASMCTKLYREGPPPPLHALCIVRYMRHSCHQWSERLVLEYSLYLEILSTSYFHGVLWLSMHLEGPWPWIQISIP